ncbi:MAG: leucyl/phenylalanyl-tRNA--protein transferase, partial [Bacteroidota bacterium]
MPVFRLTEEVLFPHPSYAEEGLLAVGGDLGPDRLLTAYANGIFPWYSPEEPIMWWSPDPRFILYPEDIKISKSMKQVIRRKLFHITFDQDFPAVIRACQK